MRAIAGGGRYDNLIAQLSDGAVSLPALGFAMGDVVLGELIRGTPAARAKDGSGDRRASSNSIFTSSSRRRSGAPTRSRRSRQLRDSGYRVDYPLTPAKVGKQFQTAEQLGARVAVLFGDEWPQVKVKDLRDPRRKTGAATRMWLAAVRQAFCHPERTRPQLVASPVTPFGR